MPELVWEGPCSVSSTLSATLQPPCCARRHASHGEAATTLRLGTFRIFTDKPHHNRKDTSMNSQTTGLRVASVVFALFALGHVVRLINHARVIVGTHHAPMWVSVVALIIAGGLSIWMWRLASGRST